MKTRSSTGLTLAFAALVLYAAGCDGDDDNPDATTPAPDARVDGGGGGGGDIGGGPDAEPDAGADAGMPMGESFVATLSGAEEVPPVTTTATGTAELTVDDRGMVTYRVRHNVEDATAGHIHVGIGGRSGAVLIPLDPIGTDISGTFTLDANGLEMLENGDLYVNIHSPRHPSGEIRGQLLRPGEKLYVARLDNLEEVPVTTATTTGVVALILDADKDDLRYAIVTDAPATAAHIHRGAAGVSGGVVFAIDYETKRGVASVDATQVADLEAGLWYANVHTMRNMPGEIRGQMIEPGAHLFVANLTGEQEVPPVINAPSTGQAMVILDYNLEDITYYVTTTATVVMSHIHGAPGGVSGGVIVNLAAAMDGIIQGTTSTTADVGARGLRGLWYVNVHTAANPSGEIRGQLLGVGETLYTAILSGANEVPPNMSAATGGFGLIVSADGMSAKGDGLVDGLSGPIVAAHIHEALAGMDGPPIHNLLFAGDTLGAELTLEMDDPAALDREAWYVNVHTMMFMDGEIRGQLIRK